MITYKFRLYPNNQQRERLDLSLDICRQTYNNLLEELQNQTKINRSEIQHKIVELKESRPELKEVYSKTLQYECYRLFSNLSALKVLKKNGRKVGRLRFKGRGWFKTMQFNQSGFSLEIIKKQKGILHLSKIGDIQIKVHREVVGKIKQITIKKSINKWYAHIITDADIKIIRTNDKVLGLDVGINNYIMDSEGNSVKHPKVLEKHLNRLKKAHRSISRKKKGSKNRWKARIRLQKIQETIVNTRNDFFHKVSTKYARECKIVCVEKLNIKKMMGSSYNAKNIADSCWYRLRQMLDYKVESTNGQVVLVNPANTTKDCSSCGHRQPMEIWKRIYKCESCGMILDRDYNSAINILKGGQLLLGMEYPSVEKTVNTLNEQTDSMNQEALSFRLG
jgi:putative transposase